jgi:hypothetical protein
MSYVCTSLEEQGNTLVVVPYHRVDLTVVRRTVATLLANTSLPWRSCPACHAHRLLFGSRALQTR